MVDCWLDLLWWPRVYEFLTQPFRYSYSRTGTSQPHRIVPLATGTSNLTLSNNICHRTGPQYLHLPAAPSKWVHHTWISLIYEDFVTFYKVNFANCIPFAELWDWNLRESGNMNILLPSYFIHIYSTYFLDYGSRPYAPRIPKACNPMKALCQQPFKLATTGLWSYQVSYCANLWCYQVLS